MAWYHRGLRGLAGKARATRVGRSLAASRDDDVVFIDWINKGEVEFNWGDAVAPFLVEALSGKRVLNSRDHFVPPGRVRYSTIGSMMGTVDHGNWIVWGSGFVDSSTTLNSRPAAVTAVRGPLTRAKLLEAGVACPEVYGDPALLMPLLYPVERTAEFRLGVVPHHRERNHPEIRQLLQHDDVLVIDICAGIQKVIDEMARCEGIVSSSLHGLVAADGYGIPSRWMQVSDRPAGDGFKFMDYLTSVGREGPGSYQGPLEPAALIASLQDDPLTIDLDGFASVCPFARVDANGAPVIVPVDLPAVYPDSPPLAD